MDWFHDPARGLSIYPRSDVLLQAIPEARVLRSSHNGSLVAVPHTLRNAQVLRHFSYPVAPVITDQNYDWPAPPGVKPYASQKVAANFMALHPRCFNLSDMGVGKTNAALWASEFLMRHHPPGTFRVLVVCPLSIVETVWVTAIFRNFLSHRKVEVLYGSADRRLAKLALPADYYLVNHDGVGVGARAGKKGIVLEGFSKALAERSDIRMVIVDEASAYKDAQTKRHRIARMVIGKRDHLVLMTGTPVPNSPTDAYGLAKLINNAWGKSFGTFRSETMFRPGAHPHIWRPLRDGYEKAQKILTPAVRISIESVWDSPPVTTQSREVALTPAQTKAMADLKRDLQIKINGHEITALNEVGARLKFMQIAAGVVYDSNRKTHVIEAEPRLSEIETVIEETSRKVVIFAGLTSVIDLLYKRLSKRWSCAILNGNVPPKERADVIREFGREGGLRIVICDPQATSHGINDFVTADTCIFATPTDKTELYLQGIKRLVRPGQKFPTTIVQIVSTKLEREIFKRLEHNESMQGALLEAIERGDW